MNKKYCRECKKNFNKLGSYAGMEISRMIGYCEDEEDCWYILKYPHNFLDDCKPQIHYSSMVGGWRPLKKDKYMERLLTHQGCAPERKFRLEAT